MILAAAIVLTLAALSFTLFIRPADVPDPLPVSPLQHLEDRKLAIYDNLRDLQFEYRLGKLSDDDYSQTKLALQKELAAVLLEMETAAKNLSLAPAPPKRPTGSICAHCGATFPQTLKYCGECGRPIA